MTVALLKHPDPRLYTRVPEVAPNEFGPELAATLDAMMAIMLTPRADGNPQGVGLAGPQVGFMRRVLVMQSSPDAPVYRMVNPVVVFKSLETEGARESCLSMPGLDSVSVFRSVRAFIRYQTPEHGVAYTADLTGFEARIVQHEIDHLDGITLIHHARRGARFDYERAHGRVPVAGVAA